MGGILANLPSLEIKLLVFKMKLIKPLNSAPLTTTSEFAGLLLLPA